MMPVLESSASVKPSAASFPSFTAWRTAVLRVMPAGCLAMLCCLACAAAESPSAPGKPSQDSDFRGRVVCLAEEMAARHGADVPKDHPHQWGFRTNDGRLLTLVRTKNTEAFFTDPRLRTRELIVRGRVFPGTQLLDAIPLRSVKDGVVHDLYYWCDICAIKGVTPGECMCCQDPVELVEKPLGE
jgi:hypothetical protein